MSAPIGKTDNCELVTAEWITAVLGIGDTFGFHYAKRFELMKGVRIVFMACAGPRCWESQLHIGTTALYTDVTKGNVRDLCDVLRIPMKE